MFNRRINWGEENEEQSLVNRHDGMPEQYKHRIVIEVEGSKAGFHGMLVDGPTQLQGKPLHEKMAMVYTIIHALAGHTYELRDPEDPAFEINTDISFLVDGMHKLIHEAFEDAPGQLLCSCLDDVHTERFEFVLDDYLPGGAGVDDVILVI